MPRTLGAKDKKKRKRRLFTALGVGGAATLGGLGYLALRKKMPTVGSTSRPTAYSDIQVRNTSAPRSTPLTQTPRITAASSPPTRVTQPDIPSKPKSIPSRAEVQPNSIVPASPKLLPQGKPNPTVVPPPTVKALPPAKPQPQITKPKLIPSRVEVQPSSITPIQTPISRQPKLLPPARTPQTIRPQNRNPKLIPSRIEVQPNSIPNETPKLLPPAKTSQPQTPGNTQKPPTKKKAAKQAQTPENTQKPPTKKEVIKEAAKQSAKIANEAGKTWEAVKPGVETGGKLARKGIKAAGKIARKSNKSRKKLIIKGAKKAIKASVSDRSQEVIKKVAGKVVDNLPAAGKVAGKVARVAKDVDESVQVGRRGFLGALGIKAAIAAKKQAASAAQTVRRHPMTDLFGTVKKTRAERLAEIRAARAARLAKAGQPPNPIIKPHKDLEKLEKTIMKVGEASDAIENAGKKSLSRRDFLKTPRQYLEDYITASPEKRIPALVNYFWKKGIISSGYKQYVMDLYAKGVHPTTSMRLAKILMRISDMTGLYSSHRKLAEFINKD